MMGFDTAFDVYIIAMIHSKRFRAEMSHIIGSNATSALDI
jgi:hypothetical protein